ncbi:MAG: PilZ domain-containing protein [Rhodospirillales bacterium]|nr:PilZ domain-containing protein [Rhodospirillales bacterium]
MLAKLVPDTLSLPHPNKRVAKRGMVIKGAKIRFGGSVVDCIVLNISSGGARIRTDAVVPVPDRVDLCLSGGATFAAVRRWTLGEQIGFQFIGPTLLTGEPAQQARLIYEALHDKGLAEAVRLLYLARFFDDPHLSQIAEEAEAARARLEAALRTRVEG